MPSLLTPRSPFVRLPSRFGYGTIIGKHRARNLRDRRGFRTLRQTMSGDERYIEIDGRRWRRADPAIPEALKSELVSELTSARRAVKAAKHDDDGAALGAARARVQDAKVALGERGPPWWEAPDEAALRERLGASIRTLLRKRGEGKTICPSDAARVASGDDWRAIMDLARDVAWQLADEGWVEVLQKGIPAERSAAGPVRLRKSR